VVQVNQQEFKAWFEGFTAEMDELPTKEQWAKVCQMAALIDGQPTTSPAFEKLWNEMKESLKAWHKSQQIDDIRRQMIDSMALNNPSTHLQAMRHAQLQMQNSLAQQTLYPQFPQIGVSGKKAGK
jgi:hypothetical protein